MKNKLLTLAFIMLCTLAIAQPISTGGGTTPYSSGGKWSDVTGGIGYSSGNVGINTTAPQYSLDVRENSSGPTARIGRRVYITASGDAATDTAAINAAIQETGVNEIYLSGGIKVSSTILINKSGIVIDGQNSTTINNQFDGPAITVSGGTVTQFKIRNLGFWVNKTFFANAQAIYLAASNSGLDQHGLLENLYIQQCGGACIEMANTTIRTITMKKLYLIYGDSEGIITYGSDHYYEDIWVQFMQKDGIIANDWSSTYVWVNSQINAESGLDNDYSSSNYYGIKNTGNGNKFIDCGVNLNFTDGWYITGARTAIINGTAEGNGQDATVAGNWAGVRITSGAIDTQIIGLSGFDTTAGGTHYQDYFVYVDGANSTNISNMVVRGQESNAVYVTGDITNLSIKGNLIRDTDGGAAIYLDTTSYTMDNILITDNMFFDDQGTPTQTYGIEVGGTGILNNVVINNNQYSNNTLGKTLNVNESIYVDNSIYGSTSLELYGGNTLVESDSHVTILANGNIGIGSTAPQTKLDVNGTATATAFVGDGSGLTGISGSGDFNDTEGYVPKLLGGLFEDSSIYVDNSGNIGIGTTAAGSILELYRNSSAISDFFTIANRNTGGDAMVEFEIKGSRSFVAGINSSGTDRPFCIGEGSFLQDADPFCISPSENVGIKDASPDAYLEISLDGQTATSGLMISSNDANDGDVFLINGVGSITTNGSQGISASGTCTITEITNGIITGGSCF